jgi:hypothetical protein
MCSHNFAHNFSQASHSTAMQMTFNKRFTTMAPYGTLTDIYLFKKIALPTKLYSSLNAQLNTLSHHKVAKDMNAVLGSTLWKPRGTLFPGLPLRTEDHSEVIPNSEVNSEMNSEMKKVSYIRRITTAFKASKYACACAHGLYLVSKLSLL